MVRLIVFGLVVCAGVASAVAGIAVVAVLLRNPADPPVAVRVPDLAFFIPGVENLVEWEGKRDARRGFRAEQVTGSRL